LVIFILLIFYFAEFFSPVKIKWSELIVFTANVNGMWMMLDFIVNVMVQIVLVANVVAAGGR